MSEMQGGGPPIGYVLEDYFGRMVIRCKHCGMRWYADRMTHWANEVFLVEHREKHKPMKRKRPAQLPVQTATRLPRQQPD